MAQMHRWLAEVRAQLQLQEDPFQDLESELLSLIGTVAPGPFRPGAPLTAFLTGYLVGKGADAKEIIGQLQKLAKD